MMTKTWLSALSMITLAAGCETLPGDDDGGDGGGGGGRVCSTARLVAGNPRFSGDIDRSQWNPAGHGVKADPPLLVWSFAGRGSQLLVNTQESLWLTDLSAASPSFRRVSGDDALPQEQYQPSGACSTARHMAGDGLAWMPSGRAALGDYWANGVTELSDPTGAGCTASPIAGTQTTVNKSQLPSTLLYQPGDVDGPGAQARFGGPFDPTADADGNLYVWDDGNEVIKKIASDASRTVSRLYPLAAPLQVVNSMTAFGGKLYASGATSNGGAIIEIDTASGATREVASGDIFDQGTAGGAIAMTNDGTDLLVKNYRGYLYRVTLAGAVTQIGGAGVVSGSYPDIDLSGGPVPADQVPVTFPSMVIGDSLYWNAGHLYVTDSRAIWDFTCE